MADVKNDLWIQITEESEEMDDTTPVDLAGAKDLIKKHNESTSAHADIREQLQAIADMQTQEIKEYGSKRDFPVSGDTSVSVYVDISTGNLYRYDTSARQYKALAMDAVPASIALEGVPTAPTAKTGTNTSQIATTQFVQNELAQFREQSEAATPVYYDGKTKAKLSLLGDNGTLVTNVTDGRIEQGSSDAVTGGQLWNAQQDMERMSALAARNIAANAAEIELLKRRAATIVQIEGSNINVSLAEEGDTRTFTLAIPEDGTVTEEETKPVTGQTVYRAIQDAKGYISGGTGITVTDGVVAIDDTVATKKDVENAAFANRFKIINGDHTAAMLGKAEGQPTYAINVRANGSVQKNDGRIITGGIVYEEVRLDADGHFVLENNTAAQNIVVLDEKLQSLSAKLDTIPEAFELANNVAALQTETETIKADIEAVKETAVENKNELLASIHAIEERGATFLDKDLADVSTEGIQRIKELAREGMFKVVNGDHTTATLGKEDGVPTYAINVRATGRIQDNDGRIVTGQTIYKEVRPAKDGSVILANATTGENLSALDASVGGLQDRVGTLEENIHSAGDYITISDQGAISVTVDGQVAQGNVGLLTGDQVADAISNSEAKTGLLIKDVHDEMVDRINQMPAQDTRYVIEKDPDTNQLVLRTEEGTEVSRIQLATDTDTKYSLEKDGNIIRLIPNNDPTQAIPIELNADLNTTYTFSLDDAKDLVITPNDDTAPVIIPLGAELDKKADKTELENYVPWTDISTEDNPNRDAIVLKNHDGLFGTTSQGNTELLAMVSKWDVADFGNTHMRTNLNTDNVVTVNDSQIVVTDKNLGEFIKAGDGVELTKQTVTVDPTTGFTADIVTINSHDTQYTAGDGIAISDDNQISVQNMVERQILSNGNEALIFNESDGGGAKFTNTAKNTIAFAGVNDGSGNIDVQLYALDKTTKTGTRININPDGAYYTVRNNMAFTAEDEIVTRRDLNSIGSAQTYNTMTEFPTTGEEGKIYVDSEKNSIYRWDSSEGKYKELQGNTINDCVIDIQNGDDGLVITRGDGTVDTVPYGIPLTSEDIATLF